MTDFRLTFEFPGMSKRRFFALAREVDEFVWNTAKNVPREFEYMAFASPEGPLEWDDTEVEIRLHGIRAERACARRP